ncbi:MAG: PEP-CTERM sorting domain-containing protein [Planctomycetota bacterium]
MKAKFVTTTALVAFAGAAMAQDGINIGAGQTLLGVQDTATQFGNATGGGQDSAGGSEVNSLWGSLGGGTLDLGIAGNLEGNFNKMWIFIDATAGGENTLQGDNVDGGFNEIASMAGLTFDAGFEPDHAIRLEVGGGFLGIRFADLIDNTAGDIFTAGGTGDLPLVGAAGAFGITTGWDNSNIVGVDDVDASGALTATTGVEFSIDLATAFGVTNSQIGISVFISNDNGQFLSNQFLGETGLGGAGNVGDPTVLDLNTIAGNQFATIPAPASMALLGLGGLAAARRRR